MELKNRSDQASLLSGDLAYRPHIDGLRGLAVLLVIVYHAWPSVLPGGFIGVDVFFVISGYLITDLIQRQFSKGSFSFRHFYARRIRRLFPALLLTLAVTLFLGCLFLTPGERIELGRKAAASAFFVPNLAMIGILGYFDLGARQDPLMHLWSLGVEEQFYLIWPIALLVMRRLGVPFRPIAAVLLLGSLAACALSVQSGGDAYYLPYTRAWELLSGACFASWPRAGIDAVAIRRWASLGALISAGLILLPAALLDGDNSYPSWWGLLPVIGSVGLIVCTPRASIASKVLGWRPLVLVGLISYPLYLYHWPALSFGNRLWPDWLAERALQPCMIAFAAVLAWLTYKYLEMPVRRKGGTGAVIWLSSGVFIVGMVGLALYRGQPISGKSNHIMADYVRVPTAYKGAHCCITGRPPSNFCADCLELEPASFPLVVLLGDSHAGSLRPGLDALQKRQKFRLAQWTEAGCPPYDGAWASGVPYCQEINTWVLARIAKFKPDTVILASNWDQNRGLSGRVSLSGILKTIATLRKEGVHRIIVFGQLPLFDIPNPEIGLEELPQGHLYSWSHVNRRCFETDQLLARQLQGLGVEYVRPLSLLCNDAGCRDSVSRSPFEPLEFDTGHLTMAGSEYLIFKSGLQLGTDRR